MRMRKKSNLEKRVDKFTENLLVHEDPSSYKREDKESAFKLDLSTVFKNNNPIHLEIGCGKGDFIKGLSENYPKINYIGVERITNVIITALEKCEVLENVKFLNCDAQNLDWYLPTSSIEKIYLNFSCPFPKKAYANRRLTNKKFLEIYKKICIPNFTIEQKTDSVDFFNYSLEQYELAGYKVLFKTYDLYSEDGLENVKKHQTEFEKKFVSQGKKICYCLVTI